MTDIHTGILLTNPSKAIPHAHTLFNFEIRAYERRYDVTTPRWRIPLNMQVKDAAILHERRCREAYLEFTQCRDIRPLSDAEEAAADWQFENDLLDRELFGWSMAAI